MAEAAENNVTPISADSKLTDEQKRDQLRARIEAGEKRNEERSLGDQAKGVADSAIEFTKKHPLAVVAALSPKSSMRSPAYCAPSSTPSTMRAP